MKKPTFFQNAGAAQLEMNIQENSLITEKLYVITEFVVIKL